MGGMIIPDRDLAGTIVSGVSSPFAAKVLPNGKKLYRRVHGITGVVQNAADNIDFLIPYNECKLTAIEVIAGKAGDTVNLKILDTPTGTLSGGTPYFMLNQFGFDVNIADDFYSHASEYDADMIKDLTIRIEYDAADEITPRTVRINFILHEVKT